MQKHLLTKIKALYANTQNHHGGEGTSSRNLHLQTSHMLLQDIKGVYECQPTSRLVTLFDNLSFRERHDNPVRMSSMYSCYKSLIIICIVLFLYMRLDCFHAIYCST
jgi:hypothetical protein